MARKYKFSVGEQVEVAGESPYRGKIGEVVRVEPSMYYDEYYIQFPDLETPVPFIYRDLKLSDQAKKDREQPGWIVRILAKRDAIGKALGRPLGPVLGCGHFGCVFAWKRPWVVKITRDPTEGPMWTFLKEFIKDSTLGRHGLVRIQKVLRLKPDIEWRGQKWPVHAIVREEVAPAYGWNTETIDGISVYGSLYTLDLLRRSRDARRDAMSWNLAKKAIASYQQAATRWHTLKRSALKQQADYAMDDALEEMFGTDAVGYHVAETLATLKQEGVILKDVHIGNVGWRIHEDIDGEVLEKNHLVIFDPGHTPVPAGSKIEEFKIGYKPNLT